jgi:hypothetical protein
MKKAHDLHLDLAEFIVTLVRILVKLFSEVGHDLGLDLAEIIVTFVRGKVL